MSLNSGESSDGRWATATAESHARQLFAAGGTDSLEDRNDLRES